MDRRLTYARAKSSCVRLAKKLEGRIGASKSTPQIQYILKQIKLLKDMTADENVEKNGIVFEINDVLAEALPDFINGRIDSDAVFAKLRSEVGPFWWSRLMMESPMNDYAEFCFQFAKDLPQINGHLLELGGGVGNLSRLVTGIPEKYYRTDIEKIFLTGRYSSDEFVYDFETPCSLRGLDIVIAVNSLHRARDKAKTLVNIYETLKPGGIFVMAEGEPYVAPSEPWALGLVFSLMKGWWDIGGFETRTVWSSHMALAGFVDIGTRPMLEDGLYDLGGVVWGYKSTR